MKTEKETKTRKEYATPKMAEVKLHHQVNLMSDSCPSGNCVPGWNGEFQ